MSILVLYVDGLGSSLVSLVQVRLGPVGVGGLGERRLRGGGRPVARGLRRRRRERVRQTPRSVHTWHKQVLLLILVINNYHVIMHLLVVCSSYGSIKHCL